MKKILLALTIIVVCNLNLFSQMPFDNVPIDTNSVLIKSIKQELNRSFNEFKKEANPPYFISYQVVERLTNRIEANFGKLANNSEAHNRSLDIDLRVGDYKLDNTHIIRGNNDFGGSVSGSATLPLEDDEIAIRNAVWLATDRAFRRSIEKYEKALANQQVKVAAEDTSADFSKEPTTKYFEHFRQRKYYNSMTRIFFDPNQIFALDTAHWIAVCKRLSKRFVAQKWLLEGNVSFSSELTNKVFVNTDGTEIQVSETGIRIMVNAKTKSDDGMILPLYKSYFAFNVNGLPSEETVAKDIDELISLLEKLRNAPVATTFTGPAILSGEAAGVFFHEIFGHRVEGFREKDPEASNTFKQSIGKKVLPDFLDVVFDPSLQTAQNGTDLAGYYKFDDEGIPGSKVETVKNGIFKQFLMSRSPIEGFEHSNGHGRKSQGRSVVTRQSNLMVVAHKTNTKEQLKQMLIAEAKKQNKEYGLYFEKVSGGFTMITRFYPNAFNVLPLVVYKIFTDGSPDELVRGVDLIGTPLTTFANIIGVADDLGVFNGVCGAESGWVPVSASSPTLLVSSIEVQKKSKSQARNPVLPFPIEQGKAK